VRVSFSFFLFSFSLGGKEMTKTLPAPPFFFSTQLRETFEFPGSGGSMVASLKLKGIDGRAHNEMEFAA